MGTPVSSRTNKTVSRPPYLYNGNPHLERLSYIETGPRCYVKSQHYDDVIMNAVESKITSLTIVYRLFRRRSKKTSNLRVTGLCGNAENVSISWRHLEVLRKHVTWRHDMETFYALLAACEEKPHRSAVSGGFPSQKGSNMEFYFFIDISLVNLLSKWLRFC